MGRLGGCRDSNRLPPEPRPATCTTRRRQPHSQQSPHRVLSQRKLTNSQAGWLFWLFCCAIRVYTNQISVVRFFLMICKRLRPDPQCSTLMHDGMNAQSALYCCWCCDMSKWLRNVCLMVLYFSLDWSTHSPPGVVATDLGMILGWACVCVCLLINLRLQKLPM